MVWSGRSGSCRWWHALSLKAPGITSSGCFSMAKSRNSSVARRRRRLVRHSSLPGRQQTTGELALAPSSHVSLDFPPCQACVVWWGAVLAAARRLAQNPAEIIHTKNSYQESCLVRFSWGISCVLRMTHSRSAACKDFIVAASKANGEALVSIEPEIQNLVALYAMVSRMPVG